MTTTAVKPTQLVRDLQGVRGLLEDGWTQDHLYRNIDGKHHFCMLGAITWQVYGTCDPPWNTMMHHPEYDRYNRLVDVVSEHLCSAQNDHEWDGIEGYNDYPDRTQRDVLTLIDDVIAEMERV